MFESSFPQPEQDRSGDGNLPTYDAVAAQAGPNSRFGRWRGWVEKRAAERYADITPEEAARRKARGWGNGDSTNPERSLHIQTNLERPPPPTYPTTPPSPSPIPFAGEVISPTHLQIGQFGSRFLPHSTSPIRCILPVLADSLILIGHDSGLSVLNMYPKEWTEDGLANYGPSEATARVMWEGEAVYQLSLLEVDDNGPGTPTGVILALVGSFQADEDTEMFRSLRMYNLSSIVSLAKWTVSSQYTHPLDLCSLSGNPRRGSSKKNHKGHGPLTKGFKNFTEPPLSQCVTPFDAFIGHGPSSSSPLTTVEENNPMSPPPQRSNTAWSADSSWDVVDDLPLKWATDYVSLATAGSRLANTNVLFSETWSDMSIRGRKGALLAVATKSSILLYETPKGERAFRFVKEFYIPMCPRAVSFVHQAVSDPISRSASDLGPSRLSRSSPSRIAAHISHQRSSSSVIPSIRYPNELSLFVTFEKKAGLIRISDSVVAEVELLDESQQSRDAHSTLGTRDTLLSPANSRRNRTSWDGFGFIKEKPSWTLPTKVDLSCSVTNSSIYLLTRSKRTHIVPYPLPANLPGTPSFRVFSWSFTPKHVQARVCRSPFGEEVQTPFLQLIAFGEDGVEVQEIPLNLLSEIKGKTRATLPVQGFADLGGETAPLCAGGHWHNPELSRNVSTTSDASGTSFDSYETNDLVAQFRGEQGIYGWVQKGLSDWRVFWVGGTGSAIEDNDDRSTLGY